MAALLRIGLTLALLPLGATLECYQCANLEFQSGNSQVQKRFSGRTDPSCVSASGGATVQCRAGQACVVYKGQVSGDTLLGSFEVSTLIRDCWETSGVSDGCHGTDDVSSSVKGLLGFVLSFLGGLGSVNVDGSMCQCSSDLCVPDCSGFFVGDFCLTWVILGASIGGAVLLLILLCACCCCCCGCCRSSKGHTQPNTVMVVSTPGGGIVNPGYGNNYTV